MDASRHGIQQRLDHLGRRQLLLGGLLLAGAAAAPSSLAEVEAAAATSTTGAADDLVTFANPSQGYTLLRPAAWEQVRSLRACHASSSQPTLSSARMLPLLP